MAQDPWAQFNPQSAVPEAGPVYGAPPKPDKPDQPKTTWRTVPGPDGKPVQISSEGKMESVPGADNIKPPFSPEDLKSANLDAREKLGVIQRLYGGSNSWFGTGFGADTLSNFGGTNAANVKADIDRLNAAAGLKKILDMAQQNGGKNPLAPMSQGDVETIAKSVGNLDIKQGDDQFQRSLLPYLHAYMSAFLATGGTSDELKAILSGSDYTKNFTTDEQGNVVEVAPGLSPNPPTGGGTPPPSGGGDGGFLSSVGDVVQGVGSLAGIIGNPLNATINAVTGSNLSTDLGKTLRDTTGLPDNSDPTLKAVNMGAAGGFGLAGAARKAAQVATSAPVRNALAQFGAAPGRDAVAGGAAGLGGDIARRNDTGPAGEVAGAVAGGLLGYKAAGIANPRGPNALAGAMQRQGVNVLPADAGGTASKIITSGAKASPLSAGPVRAAAQENINSLAGAVERTAGGTRLTSDKAGEAIRGAAERYGKESRQRGEVMYDKAFAAAKGVKIKPANTIAAIDEQLARLSENPADNGAVIKELQSLRANIDGGVSIQGLRDARTQLSQGVYDGKLRSGADKARWQQVLGNIADDIDAGLRSVGREGAANLFRRADDFWKGRVEHIDEVLEPLIGKGKSGEDIVKNIESMTKGGLGGNARLSRLLGGMDAKEAAGVRATIITRLGRAKKGAQDETGDVFSPTTFLSNWSDMTPQAKASLFSDPAQRANLNDIALIASRMKATESMANHSNTTLAASGNLALGAAAAMSNPAIAVIGAGAQYATGRLMASPGFARILAKTAKLPPQAAQRSFKDQIKVLGTREPALRSDISALLDRMGQAANQSPAPRAAAEDQDK